MLVAGAATWIAAPPKMFVVGMLGVTVIYVGGVALLLAMLPTDAAAVARSYVFATVFVCVGAAGSLFEVPYYLSK